MSAVAASGRRPVPAWRRRLGAVCVASALPVALLVGPAPAGALDGTIRADDPSALSVALSAAAVPAGSAEAVFVAPDDDPADLAGVGAALGAVPGPTSLLLSSPGGLDAEVAAELDRIRNDRTVAYVVQDAALASAVEARGVSVVLVTGDTPQAVAVALANQTYGADVGHGQRVVVTDGDLRVAGLANAYAVNLGIPVIPLQDGTFTTEAAVREVLVISETEVDISSSTPTLADPPAPVTRFDASEGLDALGQALGDALAAEPLDGFLEGRTGTSRIILDDDEVDPHPALLASVAAAAHALDGFDATVRFFPRGDRLISLPMGPTGQPGPVVSIGLTGAGETATPAPVPPLPVTGGGLAVGGALAAAGLVLRRRA